VEDELRSNNHDRRREGGGITRGASLNH
jgi:hypothetical protein